METSRSRGLFRPALQRFWVLPLALVFSAADLPAQIDEYQLKAAFLYNFAKFVEWPPPAFGGQADPITICIVGQNPFGHTLEDAVVGKQVGGRPFLVREMADAHTANGCQIAFISASERKHLRAVLDTLRPCNALTVGDTAGFAAQGGVINLKLEGSTVRLEVNVAAAAEKNIHISSKLLGLAQIVK